MSCASENKLSGKRWRVFKSELVSVCVRYAGAGVCVSVRARVCVGVLVVSAVGAHVRVLAGFAVL
jgi:hypothetical protein